MDGGGSASCLEGGRMRKRVLELVLVIAMVALMVAGLAHLLRGPETPRQSHSPPPAPPPAPARPGAPPTRPPPPPPYGAPFPAPPPPPPPGVPPNYRPDSPQRTEIGEGRPGGFLDLQFVVRDPAGGRPLEGAKVEVWHADSQGRYSQPPDNFCRGWSVTDADGRVGFRTVRPSGYGSAGAHPHIHWRISKAGVAERSQQLDLPDAQSGALRGEDGTVARLVWDGDIPVVEVRTTLPRPGPPYPPPGAPPPPGLGPPSGPPAR